MDKICNNYLSLFWVSQNILIGGNELALANESPSIRVSGDTQNKLFNKELVSRLWCFPLLTAVK